MTNVAAMTNLVVLVGRLARPAEQRELPSGARLVAYEVTVSRPGARAEGVPVVWPEAPASAGDYDVGEVVLVVGRVRRRFFRAGGATQSRTEVVAEVVVPTRLAKRARAALETACSRMEETLR
ncbi:MAG TPA: single-stranded DNA-binding protein [Acidimicrobiales bacterium]|nr:single-stranded DNA-binding protein [Acidimicrobiales bacterium]